MQRKDRREWGKETRLMYIFLSYFTLFIRCGCKTKVKQRSAEIPRSRPPYLDAYDRLLLLDTTRHSWLAWCTFECVCRSYIGAFSLMVDPFRLYPRIEIDHAKDIMTHSNLLHRFRTHSLLPAVTLLK